mmetsp:Transcript_5862/g.5259  ORF Transcript_5862/g.5259 Transcript_5862/m.5259 type:complete len:351 (+) Transcript_5862:37-1089(+)
MNCNLVKLLVLLVNICVIICNNIEDINTCSINDNGEEVCVVLPKGANTEGKPADVSLAVCKDRHEQCIPFAAHGECTKNPGWMIVNCPNSCNSCHLLDPKVRCDRARLNITLSPAYAFDEMEHMFSTIEERFKDRYDVNIISTDPWVVTFDNFLNDDEINALITTVEDNWERSTDSGQTNEFGMTGRVLSTGRTSSNAWCRSKCENHPDVQSATRKIEEVVNIPSINYESYQILQYNIGQLYRTHHDAGARQINLACGPRILTFFLYLSDVEEGGETAFPTLDIAVKPKRGRALLWPSTTTHDPSVIDQRTVHEARPVIKGRKYAANAWIHLYDFKTANLWGCTGSFDEL